MRRAIPILLLGACRFDSGGVAGGDTILLDSGPQDAGAESPPLDACADGSVCCGEPDGKRACSGGGQSSAECLGGAAVRDRECPPGSTCQDFVCALSAACEVCAGSSCGAGRMCSVFVTVGAVNTCCTSCFGPPRGCGAPGTPCGDNDDCASGICVPADGGSGRCYFNCQDSSDCGDGGVCDIQFVRVDGLERGVNGCVAP